MSHAPPHTPATPPSIDPPWRFLSPRPLFQPSQVPRTACWLGIRRKASQLDAPRATWRMPQTHPLIRVTVGCHHRAPHDLTRYWASECIGHALRRHLHHISTVALQRPAMPARVLLAARRSFGTCSSHDSRSCVHLPHRCLCLHSSLHPHTHPRSLVSTPTAQRTRLAASPHQAARIPTRAYRHAHTDTRIPTRR